MYIGMFMGRRFDYWVELEKQVTEYGDKAGEITRLIEEIAHLRTKGIAAQSEKVTNEARYTDEIALLMSKVTFYESRIKEMHRFC